MVGSMGVLVKVKTIQMDIGRDEAFWFLHQVSCGARDTDAKMNRGEGM